MGPISIFLYFLIGPVLLKCLVSAKYDEEDLDDPFIEIDKGVLQGRTVTTDSGFQYDSYQGIPYARPPLGDLRFRNPQPAGPWGGVLNATAPGNACAQLDPLFQKTYYGTEDCLFLNVYVPNTGEEPENLPVMFWIHGAGFMFGDGGPTLYAPDGFVEKNVIVVTINYRLGAFGFLCLNTADVPGNAGLKDQALALKWVNENIAYFGGDPLKVTIFGQSAGGASVQYHMLSPMSRGLFRGAISQSGSSLCPWALQTDPKSVAKEFARVLGIRANDTNVGTFLRSKPESELVFAAISPNLIRKLTLSFAPVVERTFPNVVPFITRPPQEIMNSGSFYKVPTITGLTSNDGLIYRIEPFTITEDLAAIASNTIPNLKKFVPDALITKFVANGTTHIEAQIERFYFPTKDTLSNNLTNLYTDFTFVKDIVASVRLLARYSYPAYFYKFSYSGSINLMRLLTGYQYTGSALFDELAYMFSVSLNRINQIPLTQSDDLISEQLHQMWTNFAKFRNPTPWVTPAVPLLWTPVRPQASRENTLDIDDPLRLVPNPFSERVKFWLDLVKNN